MPKIVDKKVLVVAGSKDEYKEYLSKKVIPYDLAFKLSITPKYVFAKIKDHSYLNSIEIIDVVVYGSWEKRIDIHELEMEIQIQKPNFKFNYHERR